MKYILLFLLLVFQAHATEPFTAGGPPGPVMEDELTKDIPSCVTKCQKKNCKGEHKCQKKRKK